MSGGQGTGACALGESTATPRGHAPEPPGKLITGRVGIISTRGPAIIVWGYRCCAEGSGTHAHADAHAHATTHVGSAISAAAINAAAISAAAITGVNTARAESAASVR
jgi:hypothetical protein